MDWFIKDTLLQWCCEWGLELAKHVKISTFSKSPDRSIFKREGNEKHVLFSEDAIGIVSFLICVPLPNQTHAMNTSSIFCFWSSQIVRRTDMTSNSKEDKHDLKQYYLKYYLKEDKHDSQTFWDFDKSWSVVLAGVKRTYQSASAGTPWGVTFLPFFGSPGCTILGVIFLPIFFGFPSCILLRVIA